MKHADLMTSVAQHARTQPGAIALCGSNGLTLTYAQLDDAVAKLSAHLVRCDIRCIALIADNGPGWALVDLAALAAGLRIVPIPTFFSAQQTAHALQDAGVDALIQDPRLAAPEAFRLSAYEPLPLPSHVDALALRIRKTSPPALGIAPATQKITYTSGTTGTPRGVCLSAATLQAQSRALCEVGGAGPFDVHLSCTPLATLLENLSGLYAPLYGGARTCLPPLNEVGLSGASAFDPGALLDAIGRYAATTLVLVPQQLQALVHTLERRGAASPRSLRFVAVGGAPMPAGLLERAHARGLPAFEGYGLSECASVVSLNRPGAHRPGSVGRVLPGLELQVLADGELCVQGRGFLGYVGEPLADATRPVHTGDLGRIDSEGFVHVTGRKKNLFITAFGRNVSPEWVERELAGSAAIAQSAVFGEARPFNTAVIVSASADSAIEAAVQQANAQLPDYARVQRWLRADAPFSIANHQLTANGRPRREAISTAYRARLDALYPHA